MVVRLERPRRKPVRVKRGLLTYQTKYWILTLFGLPYLTLVLVANLYITNREIYYIQFESNVTSRWFEESSKNVNVSIPNKEIIKPVNGSGNYIFKLYNKSWSSYKSITNGRVILRSYDGEVVLNKSIEQYVPIFSQNLSESHTNSSQLPWLLKQWNPKEEALAFMHIGKNGGTSFRTALLKAKHKAGLKLQNLATLSRQPFGNSGSNLVPCICSQHYDWSHIQQMQDRGVKVAPLVMLRHPVQRAISHFHFAQTLAWTRGMEIRKLSLSDYLNNPKEMLNTRGVWQDGQAAVSWLTGR